MHLFEKPVSDGRCNTMELWEDGTGKSVCFGWVSFLYIQNFVSFQDDLKSKFRHAELL